MFKRLMPPGDVFFGYVDENELLLGEKVEFSWRKGYRQTPLAMDSAYDDQTLRPLRQLLIFEFCDVKTQSIAAQRTKTARFKKNQDLRGGDVFVSSRRPGLTTLTQPQLQAMIQNRNERFDAAVASWNGSYKDLQTSAQETMPQEPVFDDPVEDVPKNRGQLDENHEQLDENQEQDLKTTETKDLLVSEGKGHTSELDRSDSALKTEGDHTGNKKQIANAKEADCSTNSGTQSQKPSAAAMLAALKSPPLFRSQTFVSAPLCEPRPANYAPAPDIVHPEAAAALWRSAHIDSARLYSHQAAALSALLRGHHTIVSTATSLGKSLVYQLPIISDILRDADLGANTDRRTATALFVFPTKALAQDQKRHLLALLAQLPGRNIIVDTYDGDTSSKDRRHVRSFADIIFTNPDAIHAAILPNALDSNWRDFLACLKYVVVDELHVYRGTFGVNVGFVMARLNRMLERLAAHPLYVSCSATISNAEEHFRAVCALPDDDVVEHVDEDGSPATEKMLVVWEPPVLMNKRGQTHLRGKGLMLNAPKMRNRNVTDGLTVADPSPSLISCKEKSETAQLPSNNESPLHKSQAPDTECSLHDPLNDPSPSHDQSNGPSSHPSSSNDPPSSNDPASSNDPSPSHDQSGSAKRIRLSLSPPVSLPMLPRESILSELARVLVHLLCTFPSIKAIVFCPIRQMCELVIKEVRTIIRENIPQWHGLHERDIMAYRGGYSKSDRRAIEHRMFLGQLRAIVATNTLELGIDLSDLDVVISCGFPQLKLNLHQQFGRAGRGRDSKGSLAILVCGAGPVDRYYLKNPLELCDTRSYEDLGVAGLLDSTLNHVVKAMHLQCAAFEDPIDLILDRRWFSPHNDPKMNEDFIRLCQENLHPDDRNEYRTDPRYLPWPAEKVSLRAMEQTTYAVVDITNDRNIIIEEIEELRTSFTLYEGGIFLHQGYPYLVKEFNPDGKYAKVERVNVSWVTQQRDFSDVDPVQIELVKQLFPPSVATPTDIPVFYGQVDTTIVVFGFFKVNRKQEILEVVEVNNPPIVLRSKGFWIDIPHGVLNAIKEKNLSAAGGIHAAQHAIMNILPIFLIGGATTNPNARFTSTLGDAELTTECKAPEKEFAQRQTKRKRPARLIFHDSKGGAQGTGMSAKTFELIDKIIYKTYQCILECECEWGCPLCVTGSFCKEGMLVMSKPAAIIILGSLLGYDLDELKKRVPDGPEENMPAINVETITEEGRTVKFAPDVEILQVRKAEAPLVKIEDPLIKCEDP